MVGSGILTNSCLDDRYLGLPAMVGMDRSEGFQFFVDRICKRMSGWMEKFSPREERKFFSKR
jgi:hypothetical protein